MDIRIFKLKINVCVCVIVDFAFLDISGRETIILLPIIYFLIALKLFVTFDIMFCLI